MRNIPLTLSEIDVLIDALRRTNGFAFGIDAHGISAFRKLAEAKIDILFPPKEEHETTEEIEAALTKQRT